MTELRTAQHRADAYCQACGGQCQDLLARATATATRKPLSLRPTFTGAGAPTFKPARKGKRG